MSLDIAPLPVEGTEDGALPSRGDFVSIRMPRCRVWRFCTSLRQAGERTLRCLRRFLQRRGSFQQSLVTHRRRFSPTLAPWRMTALIATVPGGSRDLKNRGPNWLKSALVNGLGALVTGITTGVVLVA